METLERSSPGRENAKDWLTLKIVECLSGQMDEKTATALSAYNGAYNAICQWSEDSEPISRTSEGPSSGSIKEVSKSWMRSIKNEDGSVGAHWSIEQVKQVMAQRKLSYDPTEFWVAMNLIYSDYSRVAKKLGLGGNIEFYVEMAKAFLDDQDATPEKLERYYEYIVK